jgi:hypothetical protein
MQSDILIQTLLFDSKGSFSTHDAETHLSVDLTFPG